MEQSNKNIISALVKAQSELKAPKKEGVNPMFKNKYATLDAIYNACRKPLSENGLVLSHSVEKDGNDYFLLTTLFHTSGETLSNKFPMFVEKQTNQGIASARTYACRYATCNLLAIPGDEDDDGNLSSEQIKQIEEKLAGNEELKSNILRGYKVDSLEKISQENFAPIVRTLEKRMVRTA